MQVRGCPEMKSSSGGGGLEAKLWQLIIVEGGLIRARWRHFWTSPNAFPHRFQFQGMTKTMLSSGHLDSNLCWCYLVCITSCVAYFNQCNTRPRINSKCYKAWLMPMRGSCIQKAMAGVWHNRVSWIQRKRQNSFHKWNSQPRFLYCLCLYQRFQLPASLRFLYATFRIYGLPIEHLWIQPIE